MTMDDINTVEMTVDGMTTAMISGQIDAAASWSPNTVTLQNALGDNYVDLGTNADFLDSAIFPSSYICTPEYAEANHDILVRFAQALDKAHDWRATHPEEMAKLLAKELDAPEDTMLAAVGEATGRPSPRSAATWMPSRRSMRPSRAFSWIMAPLPRMFLWRTMCSLM